MDGGAKENRWKIFFFGRVVQDGDLFSHHFVSQRSAKNLSCRSFLKRPSSQKLLEGRESKTVIEEIVLRYEIILKLKT